MKHNILAGLALVAMLGTSGTAMAQAADAPRGKTVTSQCCRCLDGNQQTVSINTRTAPWMVATGNGPAVPVSTNVSNPGWSPLAPAGWVGPPALSGTSYTYTLQIEIPKCTIGARVGLKGTFGADNSAILYLDNTQISATSGGINGFQAPNFGSFSTVLTPGPHTLKVVVSNPHSVTGLILQGGLITQCPKELSSTTTAPDGTELACVCDEERKSAA